MEWSEVKEGMVIRWRPYFARESSPITITIEGKTNNDLETELLTGCEYGNLQLSELLVPLRGRTSTVIPRWRFEKYKECIELIDKEDCSFIKERLDHLVSSYYRSYLIEKEWASEMKKRVDESLNHIGKEDE